MSEEQPKALRLAEWAEWFCRNVNDPKDFRWVHMAESAAELRRLSAELEAQGVPDGYAGSLYVSGGEHCVTVEFESAAQAQAYQNWIASAPPAPQAEELAQWKARALQAEAIVAKFMAPQASVVQQEPVAWAKDTGRKLRITTMPMNNDDGWRPLVYGDTHPAPQQEPLLFSEIWDNDAIMEVNADARLPFEMIVRFVRAIEAAHNIGEKK